LEIQFLSWERHNDVGFKPVNPNPLLLIIGCPAAVTINDQKLYRFVPTQKDENTIREMNDNINIDSKIVRTMNAGSQLTTN